jgi:hypothetical protein
MKVSGYINPDLHQTGAKPRFRKRLKDALIGSRTLLSHDTLPVQRARKCPNFSSWFDLNKRPTHKQLQTSLFKLPLEIRLLIYQQVFDAWTQGSVAGYHVVGASGLGALNMCHKNTGLAIIPCDCPSSGTVKEEPAAGLVNKSFGDYDFSYSSDFHWWAHHKADHAPPFYDYRASGRIGIFLICRRM